MPTPAARNRLGALLLLLARAQVAIAGDAPLALLPDEAPITDDDRDHWSFRPLVRPDIPKVTGADRPATPIDRFILAALEKKNLRPSPPADRATLLRRVTFDLTGLPPTPGELTAFLADESPLAYERVVDRLLASPAYGQRWAQHWLDLARFAETDGFEHDKVRTEAWRYRDWVIAALNDDLPYDRFVALQLAGDELVPGDADAALATSFVLSGPDMPDINSQEERRSNLLNELTGTVGSVMLGLQIGCAQCHDHKYDPISQGDFYRLRAVFEPAVNVKKDRSVDQLHETGAVPAASHVLERGDFRRPAAEVKPGVPRIADVWHTPLPVDDEGLPTTGRRAALARWITRPDNPLTARVIANRLWQHHFGQGLSQTPSDFGIMGYEPSHPELLDWLSTELVRGGWRLKPLHRLIVTSAVYQQASRLDENQLTRDEFAAARQVWDRAEAADPDNELLWRMPRCRLEGEAIRDAMLAASGTLVDRAGGPGVRPPLPEELIGTLLRGQWDVTSRPSEHYRRSIYLFARRNLRYPIFESFDRPDGNASCAARSRSTTAPQALLLVNGDESLRLARWLAGSVLKEQESAGAASSNPHAAIDRAYCRTLGRPATTEEQEQVAAFLHEQSRRLREDGRRPESLAQPIPTPDKVDPYTAAAWTDFCLALFNLNEFVYVD